jgi:NADH:ubiquinone oxidoreductase subunit C
MLATTVEQEILLKTTTLALHNCQQELPALVSSVRVTPEGVILRTSPAKIRPLALYIRNSSLLQFRTLVDIAVVDKLLPSGRFAVNYSFLSMVTNQRLTLQLYATETTTVPSLAAPFVNAQRLFASAS